MILAQRPDGFRIVRIETPDDGLSYRASFAGAYQDIFSEMPYQERFFPSEASSILHESLSQPENITLMAVKGIRRVVGFGLAVPAAKRRDISRVLTGLLPIQHTFYLSELGVQSGFRGKGLGKELVRHRLELIDKQRYTHVVLRTSSVRNASYEMYMKMGFDDMGVYMEVPARRLDGRVTTDRRLVLWKVLSHTDGMEEETSDPGTWGTASETEV